MLFTLDMILATGLMDEDKGRVFPGEYSVDAVSNTLNIRTTGGSSGISGLNLRSSGISYVSIKKRKLV